MYLHVIKTTHRRLNFKKETCYAENIRKCKFKKKICIKISTVFGSLKFYLHYFCKKIKLEANFQYAFLNTCIIKYAQIVVTGGNSMILDIEGHSTAVVYKFFTQEFKSGYLVLKQTPPDSSLKPLTIEAQFSFREL